MRLSIVRLKVGHQRLHVCETGAAFDMAILQRRHGAKATVVLSTNITAGGSSSFIDSGGAAARQLDGSDAEVAWKPAQYLWPRTLSLRRGEAKPLTVYYPHAGLLPQAEAQKLTAQEAVLTIDTAESSKTDSGVRCSTYMPACLVCSFVWDCRYTLAVEPEIDLTKSALTCAVQYSTVTFMTCNIRIGFGV
eukprot:COSAG02_NODE_12922_length_1472_cov_1.002913_2_plen_191_part_00